MPLSKLLQNTLSCAICWSCFAFLNICWTTKAPCPIDLQHLSFLSNPGLSFTMETNKMRSPKLKVGGGKKWECISRSDPKLQRHLFLLSSLFAPVRKLSISGGEWRTGGGLGAYCCHHSSLPRYVPTLYGDINVYLKSCFIPYISH